jgi:hypothetical protein
MSIAAGIKDVNLQSTGFVPSAAVGPALSGAYRANVQHAFDRIFFCNTADLAQKSLTFFQTGVSGSYNILNAPTVSRTKTAEDTNWDQNNQAQYSYIFTGMAFKFQTLTQQSFLASPNDLTTWPDQLREYNEDGSLQIISEDNILMRQKAVHVPEATAVTGFSGVTGTNASPIGQPIVHNGAAWASNYFSFGQMVLWVPKASRFNVKYTFGDYAKAASAAYKPVVDSSNPPVIFAEVRLIGLKLQATV